MRKNLIDKVNQHCIEHKKKIHSYIENNISSITGFNDEDKKQDILEYIYDLENIELSDDDFKKRKRIPNKVCIFERCCAKKSDGSRCSRKKKIGDYCGTHIKARPYGFYDEDTNVELKKIHTWLEEINGIHHYIDKNNNIYSSEDIINNHDEPNIIGKWKKENNKYIIKYI
jgi:hypothetical protein